MSRIRETQETNVSRQQSRHWTSRRRDHGQAAGDVLLPVRTARYRLSVFTFSLFLCPSLPATRQCTGRASSTSRLMANEDEFGASPLARSKRADAQAGVLKTDRGMEPRALELDDEMAVLYGDLVEGGDGPSTSAVGHASTLLKLRISKLQSELHASEETANAFAEELGRLREANAELAGKNRTLERNISSLFNTAKLEIERKDAEIRRLRKEPPADGRHEGHGHRGRSRSQSSGRRPPGHDPRPV